MPTQILLFMAGVVFQIKKELHGTAGFARTQTPQPLVELSVAQTLSFASQAGLMAKSGCISETWALQKVPAEPRSPLSLAFQYSKLVSLIYDLENPSSCGGHMSNRKSPLKSPIYSTDNASPRCDTSLPDLDLLDDLLVAVLCDTVHFDF